MSLTQVTVAKNLLINAGGNATSQTIENPGGTTRMKLLMKITAFVGAATIKVSLKSQILATNTFELFASDVFGTFDPAVSTLVTQSLAVAAQPLRMQIFFEAIGGTSITVSADIILVS